MAEEKAKEGVCRSDGRAVVCDAKVQTNKCMLNCAHSKEPATTTKKKEKRCKQNVGGLDSSRGVILFCCDPGRGFAQGYLRSGN